MTHSNKPIIVWLLICCFLVFSMILLGGATRLTQSGLSMVEWDPLMGAIPPVSDTQWHDTFEKYQAFPEYQIVNREMTLNEFKRIFFVEYAHRMLGRTIGLVFFLPFMFFAFTGRLNRALIIKLSVLFVLGGLQGLMGWYMVQSGLVDVPRVSPYRLAAHLMLAVLILGVMLWIVFDLAAWYGRRPLEPASTGTTYFAWAVLCAVVLMIATGAFVAGTKAGFAFNTFPKMYDRWLPAGALALEPVWRNFFENIATVQFIHRCMALALGILSVAFWLTLRRRGAGRVSFTANVFLLVLAVQIGLGVSTLLYIVPVSLAVAHQGGALVLFAVTLLINHQLSGNSRISSPQRTPQNAQRA